MNKPLHLLTYTGTVLVRMTLDSGALSQLKSCRSEEFWSHELGIKSQEPGIGMEQIRGPLGSRGQALTGRREPRGAPLVDLYSRVGSSVARLWTSPYSYMACGQKLKLDTTLTSFGW